MRQLVFVLGSVLAFIAGAWVPAPTQAQAPSPFVDVPPWHWAFDGIQQGVEAGIFTGYPTSDSEHVANALAQVYEAFAHPGHPAAQAWAEWFLTNTPEAWPQPLRSSRLVRFTLEGVRVRVQGDRAAATGVVIATLRRDGGTATDRATLGVEAAKDRGGRWRIDYASLARDHPQLFR
jgi:hypothetical protein